MNRQRGALVVAVVLTIGGLVACKKKHESAAPPPSVVVAEALTKDVPVVQEWIGTTDGDVNAQIRPKIDGYVLRRTYKEGGAVKAGDLLFEIDPRQSEAAERQARAALAQAEAARVKADRDVERDAPLAEQKALSQQELDAARAAQGSASASVQAAQAALQQARLNLAWTKVTSPISGIAGIAAAQVGDLVGPQTVLTTVSTVDPIRVLFKVSEQDYLSFAAGARGGDDAPRVRALTLLLADGSRFPHEGRLLVEAREVDARTGTMTMIGVFPNPGNLLRPGQYARVRAETRVDKDAVVVPQRSVNEMQGAFQIGVVTPDNKADLRNVRMGDRWGNLWVVEEGIKPGERVIVEGLTRVKAGSPVTPREAGTGDVATGSR